MERETGNKGEEEEGEREENEERRRVHKILKVQISFIQNCHWGPTRVGVRK